MRLNLYSIASPRQLLCGLFSTVLLTASIALPADAQRRPEMHRPDPGQGKKPQPSPPAQRAPRAIAVVEWRPDAQGRAVARLLPVTVLDEGKFQDGVLYRAAPRPMALDTGVVYEAQLHGQPIGFFTVESSDREQEHWSAVGAWKATLPRLETPRAVTQSAQVRGTQPPAANADEAQDDRDLQKKHTTVYDEDGKEIPPDQADAQADTSDNQKQKGKYPETLDRRPRVAKPGEGLPPSDRTSTTDSSSSGDSDPDRPKLKKNPSGTETKPATQAGSSASSEERQVTSNRPSNGDDTDPNRPMLKRGGHQDQEDRAASSTSGAPVPTLAKENGGRRLGATEKKAYDVVAVSDTEQTADSHSFVFKMPADERDADMEKVVAMARKEVEQFRAMHYGTPAASSATTPTATNRPRGARP